VCRPFVFAQAIENIRRRRKKQPGQVAQRKFRSVEVLWGNPQGILSTHGICSSQEDAEEIRRVTYVIWILKPAMIFWDLMEIYQGFTISNAFISGWWFGT
jgi:hypothetical protein